MAITISGQNNNDRILASDGVLDSISGFNVVGVMTAGQFDVTGKTTTNHISIGSNIHLGNAGIITATTLLGNVTGNINHSSNLLLQVGGNEKFRVSSGGQLGIGGANYGSVGQVLTSGGSASAATWSSIDKDKITEGTTEAEVVDTGSNGHFKVTTEGYERLRVSADGNLTVGAAVTISPVGNINATGIITATSFSGSGASLTNLNASNIASGTVPTARLGSGTASSSTFLAGDSTYKTVTGTTINSNADNRLITGSGTANTLNGESTLTYDGTTFTIGSGKNMVMYGPSGTAYSLSVEPIVSTPYGIRVKEPSSVSNGYPLIVASTNSGATLFRVLSGTGVAETRTMQPVTDSTYDIGTSSKRYANVYADKVDVGGTGAMKIPVGTTAQRPSAVAGDIRYNSSSTTLEFYNGSVWVGTNAAPTINSVTGTILNGVSGRTLVINCSDISASGNDVKYSNNSNGSVIATDTSPTTSGSNITSTIPSAVFNTAAGTVIKIEVLNSSGVLSVNSVTTTILGAPSGGNITTSGSYRIHTFTSSGNFVVPSGVTLTNVEYLVVAGGGGGGGSAQGHQGGGGGAGGLRTSVVGANSGRNTSAESRVTYTAGTYGVSIGGGGVGRASGAGYGGSGVQSYLTLTGGGYITSTGGGGGGMGQNDGASRGGLNGGCGGGAASSDQSIPAAGSGTSGQGYDGGQPLSQGSGSGGSGGGAGAVGNDKGGSVSSGTGAVGGAGLPNSITGSSATYSVGGDCTDFDGVSNTGAANTGDGGDGGYTHATSSGRNGGSGIVIVRYIL